MSPSREGDLVSIRITLAWRFMGLSNYLELG